MEAPMMLNTSLIRAIPHLLAILLFAFLFQIYQVFHDPTSNLLAGWSLILIYRYIIRYTITRYHQKGIRFIRAQKYAEALEFFQKSLHFFDAHPNLDKWRSIIFLSPGRYGYREMALMNLGFIYGQIGDGENAETCYRKALDMNANNGAAQSAINMLNAKSR